MNKQPEALRLANVIESWAPGVEAPQVAAELRRQHALIEELTHFLNHSLYTRYVDMAKRDELISKIEGAS